MRREQAQAVRGEVAREERGAAREKHRSNRKRSLIERAGVEELTREVSAADEPYVSRMSSSAGIHS